MKTLLAVVTFAVSLTSSAVSAKVSHEATMNLSSPDFSEGGNIPERYTCDGKDISPTLKIGEVSKEAKSLVLIVQGVNDFGKSKYSGPCPPPGTHRYYFRLYALDTTLTLPAPSKRKVVDSAIKGHIIAEATLMGRYARKGSRR